MLPLIIVGLTLTTIDAAVPRNENILRQDYRDVMTESGLVRGSRIETGEYIAFLGIPYADPPTGSNRFKAPVPRTPWSGVYEANRTVTCPQRGSGEEDCLVVNVFTPTEFSTRPLPVVFYIHGGAWILGFGPTSGVEPLINEDIIVVTFNYRLGAFGFLCLGIEKAPGNAGLKDQIAALKWVKNNIANFGGDPEDITIYGTSAGGTSVELIILSQQGEGLFQKAIIESGSGTTVWAIDEDPIKTAMELAEVLDFPNTTDIYQMIDNYISIPADRLSALNQEYYNSVTDCTFGFAPCINHDIQGVEPYITEHPYEILSQEKFERVPVMFIFAKFEGLYLRSRQYYDSNYKDRMEAAFHDFLPANLVFESDEIKRGVAQDIKHFYFGNRTVGDDTVLGYLNYFGDSMVMYSLLNSVEIHSKDNPAYLMEFMYKGGLGMYQEFYAHINFAGHADGNKHVILEKTVEGERNQLAVARMAKLVANFMKFGNPTPTTSELLPILWPQVERNNVSCLLFNDDLTIIQAPMWDRKIFWDNVYSKHRRPTK